MADNVNIIVQDTINDIVVNAAVVVETIDINVQAAVDVVDIVANPNNYVVNINRIIGEQVQSDWTQTDNQAPDYIKNKPTIPAAQVNSDWDATTGVTKILNKPTIPTATSDLTNDGEDGINPFITLADVPVPTNGLPAGGTAGQILTKVDATDYNATWQENYADWTSVVKHTVKNNGLSGTITKGTAVYVTSSNGTNMLVGRASNSSEATSSKTMGLMQSDITTTGGNQTGFVITEGLLEGLNTASATAGDPVWLGVNGALIYGLANKPYAPAHLVFIGIVTKVSAGNGEIFVKVQNGFELKEIHDVDIITTTPINGHLLGFDGTLWVNKTIASWLGYTPVTDARIISTSAPLSGGGDLSANRTLSISQASTSTDGYLSSTNWNTFNNKFTLPALTSGSILFSNGTTIAQSNSQLFWDNTNNRLGIGTTSPAFKFVVSDGTRTGVFNPSSGLNAFTFGTTTNHPVVFVANSNEYARIFTTGNLGIGTGATDAGFKLDVNGTARVSGNLSFVNLSSLNESGTLNSDSRLIIRGGQSGAVGSISLITLTTNANITSTFGNPVLVGITRDFTPTSGNATYTLTSITGVINQTGGANGITRGLYINPTLTSAADFRAIETTRGRIVFGNLPTSSAGLPTGAVWNDAGTLKIV